MRLRSCVYVCNMYLYAGKNGKVSDDMCRMIIGDYSANLLYG